MATIKPLANSIWPNALKTDSEGYVIFYPLGTNKVDINTVQWPKGDKLIAPFLYEGEVDKLVGFVDTDSIIAEENSIIYLPYKHIEIQFASIEKGTLQIHAPKASYKKVSWSDGVLEDIPEAQFKYRACKTVNNTSAVNANYKTTDIVDGIWSEPLWDLTNGGQMFIKCDNLTTFSSDLPSLTFGSSMFHRCTKLTSFSSDLSSLSTGSSMFSYCSNLTTFSSDLPNLKNGDSMFSYCSNLTTFSSDLSNLTNGLNMFYRCDSLTTFSSDLSSLTNSEYMFSDCINLTSFTSDLSSLTSAEHMFGGCNNLTTFTSDLSNLEDGGLMFSYCSNLSTFSSDLSRLKNGDRMFDSCINFTSFSFDLSNLTNGNSMFYRCTNLTSFSSNLSNLTGGNAMFDSCKLDAQSVMQINHSIKDIAAEKQLYTNGTIPYVILTDGGYSASKGFMSDGTYVYTVNNPEPYSKTIYASDVGQLTLGINVTNNSSTIQQQLEDFAKEATYESWEELKQAFVDKGWTVTFQYGGYSTSITYGLRDTEQIIPCPIYAKLVESDKEFAQYRTEDSSSFYNIVWGHEVTDKTGYTQFNSLEEAISTYNITPKN